MKICTKCRQEKPEDEFYKDSRKQDGLRSWCKCCQKLDNTKRESKYNETRKAYRKAHLEEVRLNKKQYYLENKQQVLSNHKAWRQSFKGRLQSYIRSAAKRNIPWELTEEQFQSFYHTNCHYCNTAIDGVGLDRIDSTKGYVITNIVPCCTQCNTMKLDYSKEQFLTKIKEIWEHTMKSKET
jgi:hypothetical protein